MAGDLASLALDALLERLAGLGLVKGGGGSAPIPVVPVKFGYRA